MLYYVVICCIIVNINIKCLFDYFSVIFVSMMVFSICDEFM